MPENEEAQIEEVEEEIDELSEQVALDSILSEERHDEVMEGLEECRQRLERLTTEGQNPQLEAIQAELREMRQMLHEVRTELQTYSSTRPSNPTFSSSPNPNGEARGAHEGPTTKPTKGDGEKAAPVEPTAPATPKRPRLRRI